MADPIEIDARDLLCPLPVLRLRKALMAAEPGQIVTLIATDPVAQIDVPHFCTEQGHILIDSHDTNGATHYHVRCGA